MRGLPTSVTKERSGTKSSGLSLQLSRRAETPATRRRSLFLYGAVIAVFSFLIGSLVALTFVGISQPSDFSSRDSILYHWRQLSGFLAHRAKWARWSSIKSRKVPGLHRGRVSLGDPKVPLWPMPYNVSHGKTTLAVSPQLEFLPSDISKFPPILEAAVRRYQKLIFEGRTNLFAVPPGFSESQVLLTLEIRVLGSANQSLSVGVDESYSLQVPFKESPGALLEANTVYGILRGLETFSQLCSFDFNHGAYFVSQAPWVIIDKPRFAHRGLLVDTARHFQPVAVLETILDGMAHSKLNVLHWHMVDQQAFPVQVPSFPKLWNGAHSEHERYTMDDIAHVVQMAADRGIVVMPEIDVPGHAASWGTGYPELWPSKGCKMPLDVSKNSTFDIIRGILADLKAVIPYGTIHLGGDEVDWSCWQNEEHVAQWMTERKMNPRRAYEYFVLKAIEIAEEAGWETVTLWEETFQNFGQSLNQSTVIMESWLKAELRPVAVAAGMRVLVSQVWDWYLDGLDVDWWKSYELEPCAGLPSPDLCSLIVGGEACMWTEHVDPGNIVGRIWPRAAAVAERLWSAQKYTTTVAKPFAQERILRFKCLLHRRGVGSSPITVPYKEESEPASCYKT